MTLFKHQQDLLDLNPRYWGLWWGCGTGKTRTAILLSEKNAKKTLVVGPKSLKQNWWNELDKWSEYKEASRWIVVTKEEFRRDWEKLLIENCDGLIIDEAHFFSGYKSKMFKALIKYLKKAKPSSIYALTATAYLSTPFNIMCYEAMFGRPANYMRYRWEYFYDVQMGGKVIPIVKPDAKEQLSVILNQIGSVIRTEDCLDLPEKSYKTEYFTYTKDQKKTIKMLDQHPLMATQIVYWTKMHQLSGGTLKMPESDQTIVFSSDKLKRVVELTKQYPKMVIVCRYNAELKLIAEKLDRPFVVLNGKTPQEDRQKLIDQANNAEECIFLVNSSCSEGYNLVGMNIMVFYSNGFSYKDRVQMEGRIWRHGQKNHCVYIDFVNTEGVDVAVMESMKKKEDFSLALYGKSKK